MISSRAFRHRPSARYFRALASAEPTSPGNWWLWPELGPLSGVCIRVRCNYGWRIFAIKLICFYQCHDRCRQAQRGGTRQNVRPDPAAKSLPHVKDSQEYSKLCVLMISTQTKAIIGLGFLSRRLMLPESRRLSPHSAARPNNFLIWPLTPRHGHEHQPMPKITKRTHPTSQRIFPVTSVERELSGIPKPEAIVIQIATKFLRL